MARTISKHPAGVLPRIIFAAALFGILVVTHLWLQKGADFAQGCSGFESVSVTNLSETMREEPGCAEVTNSVYATFLGVSNIAWGLLFYGLVALLRLGYAATGNDRLRLVSFALVGIGTLYTLYLVYLQAAVIGAFCVLCMLSAVTVVTLLILHIMEHSRVRRTAPSALAPALRPLLPIAGVFAVLLVADVVLAQQQDETAVPNVADTPAQETPPVTEQRPAVAITDPASQCTYDPNFELVANFDAFTTGPFLGSADAPVRVVEVFDPNCPHCKDLHAVLEEVLETHSDQARFYFRPFPLRESSFGQIVALRVAQQEGRFFELLDQFFLQLDSSWGMSLEEVVASANDAGMDADALRARLESEEAVQPILAQVLADRVEAAEAISDASGGVSVPKLIVEGRIIQPTFASYTPDCIKYFIEQAQQ